MGKVDKFGQENNIFLDSLGTISTGGIISANNIGANSPRSSDSFIVTTNIEHNNRKLLADISIINDELERIKKIIG